MTYTTVERSALYTLLMLKGAIPNTELEKVHKVALKKASRDKLVRDGLVKAHRVGRGNALELTDKGRDWSSRDIGNETLGKLSPFNAVVVYKLLNGIAAGLARHGLTLADLIAQSAASTPTASTVTEQITTAYRRLAKQPGAWVYLSELRPHVAGASKADVDSALKALYTDKKIDLTLVADQKSLTAVQRAAAIRLGVADMHLIAME